MPLLETIVLLYEVKIIPSNYNCSLHLHLDHHSSENPASDGNVSGKWTLLIDVSAV